MTIITVIAELGEFPVELPDDVSVTQLPRFIEQFGGIVVPVIEDNIAGRLFIPTGQIQGISWQEIAPPVEPAVDLAEVSYLDEEEPDTTLAHEQYPAADLTPEEALVPAGKGANGEVWVDG